MSKRETILLTTTFAAVLFAVWLALQLRAERQHTQAAADTKAAMPIDPAVADKEAVASFTAETVEHTTAASQSPPAAGTIGLASSNEAQAMLGADWLKRAEDPRNRPEMLALLREELRYSYPQLAGNLGLSAQENEEVLNFLAEQNLEVSIADNRCRIDPRCDPRATLPAQLQRMQQDLQAYLGPERYQRYEQLLASTQERRTVADLQAALPNAQRLSDATAEQLIVALADEKRSATSPGSETSELITTHGNILVGSSGDTQSRLEAATRYSERLREQASRLLTPAQMDAFNRMQDLLLADVRERLRDETTLRAQSQDANP